MSNEISNKISNKNRKKMEQRKKKKEKRINAVSQITQHWKEYRQKNNPYQWNKANIKLRNEIPKNKWINMNDKNKIIEWYKYHPAGGSNNNNNNTLNSININKIILINKYLNDIIKKIHDSKFKESIEDNLINIINNCKRKILSIIRKDNYKKNIKISNLTNCNEENFEMLDNIVNELINLLSIDLIEIIEEMSFSDKTNIELKTIINECKNNLNKLKLKYKTPAMVAGSLKKYKHIKGYGKRLVRRYKNGNKYVLVGGKKRKI